MSVIWDKNREPKMNQPTQRTKMIFFSQMVKLNWTEGLWADFTDTQFRMHLAATEVLAGSHRYNKALFFSDHCNVLISPGKGLNQTVQRLHYELHSGKQGGSCEILTRS